MTKHDFKAEAKALVAKMTLGEKMAQMRYTAPAIERLGIPAYNWWNEALHGVARCGTATVFPQPIGMAASFNSPLLEKIGSAISTEVRAKYNGFRTFGDTQIYQGLTCWSPNINIFRDPRWGRGHETYGEDPYLTGKMGTAFVRGMQGYDPVYRKVDATLKHFAVHSGPESTRHFANVKVSKKDLWETYLAAFAMCIRDAKPAAVMGAYNRVNDEAACASPFLLGECLRKAMKFEGYVVSDCGAIADINEHHHLTNDAAESSALAVKAGCELNCGAAYAALMAAYDGGLIDEEHITHAVEMLFEARLRLGLFAKDCPYDSIPQSVIECEEHRRLNRQMADEAIVLLKNDGILPLSPKKKIAVIGPNADDFSVLLGNYNGTPSRYWTILRGIQEAAEDEVIYSAGCHPIHPDPVPDKFWDSIPSSDTINESFQQYLVALPWETRPRREALIAARRADVVVFVMGLNPQMEGEEGDDKPEPDRRSLNLPASQMDLFRAVMEEGKPTIFVNISGSNVNLTEMDASCNAVIQCFYPGAEGGHALADILFGKCCPSGRLPVTFYHSVDELPDISDYRMENRTYRYFKGTPLYPFGYGLSYTTFDYSDLKVNRTADGCSAEFVLENTGTMEASETILAFMRPASPQAGDPLRKLVAFDKIALKPGEKRAISLPIPADAFVFYNLDGDPIRRTDEMVIEISSQKASFKLV